MHTPMFSSLLVFLFLSMATCLRLTGPKAASPYTNCDCQCSSLTFQDKYGGIQGNCNSADHTGARWCYVDSSHHSSCQDLQHSARFPRNPWSYEACATPDRHLCGQLGYNGYQGFQGLYRAKGYGK
eukprot:TRINITY_DN7649_c0_g1_i1.p1 TRINITY_DN7649_c0_g1~~TRINITY_DN7649_c0_g1_i1.p1  ORF type:complete len:126 (-),score=22.47 TRINITY_DN7649_c0_g1_i1:71-448(-)